MKPTLTGTLYVTCLLISQHDSTAQDCQYQYLQQPPGNLSCNPFGSRLQLSCVASGPLDQQFQITWYSSTINNSQEIATLSPDLGYTIQQHVLNNSVDNQTTITSILIKDEIGDNDTDRCVWCRIEIDGRPLPVRSNRPCILDDTGLPNCSVSPPPTNSTPVCADPSGGVAPTGLAIQPQITTLFSATTSSESHVTSSISPISALNLPQTQTLLHTKSLHPNTTLTNPSTPARFAVVATSLNVPMNVPVNVSMNDTIRNTARLGVFVVPIVLTIIIILLVGIIVFQFRRKLQGMLQPSGKNEAKGNHISEKCEIEIQPNQAYEAVTRPRPSRLTTQVPAEPSPDYEALDH